MSRDPDRTHPSDPVPIVHFGTQGPVVTVVSVLEVSFPGQMRDKIRRTLPSLLWSQLRPIRNSLSRIGHS